VQEIFLIDHERVLAVRHAGCDHLSMFSITQQRLLKLWRQHKEEKRKKSQLFSQDMHEQDDLMDESILERDDENTNFTAKVLVKEAYFDVLSSYMTRR
jgi:hypothetical protein